MRALGVTSNAPEAFGCDLLISARQQILGIQRKEFSDLLSSAHDGRLAKEMLQMGRLKHACLIVEGDGHWSNNGWLIDRYAKFSKSQLTRLLASVQSQGVWLIRTEDFEDTLRVVIDLKEWFGKDKHTALSSRPGAPATVWGKANTRAWLLWFLQGFPTVGPGKAATLLDAFDGKLPIRWSCTYEELLAVPGYGKKTVDAMWEALGGEVPLTPAQRKKLAKEAELFEASKDVPRKAEEYLLTRENAEAARRRSS